MLHQVFMKKSIPKLSLTTHQQLIEPVIGSRKKVGLKSATILLQWCPDSAMDALGFWFHITKTGLYDFDALKPHFYIVKLGFTGVYIIFLISAKNIDCGYSLEPPRRGGSNEYPQSMFWAEIWKISTFFNWKLSIFGGEVFFIFE